jgi:hypothetical protein
MKNTFKTKGLEGLDITRENKLYSRALFCFYSLLVLMPITLALLITLTIIL